MDLKELRAEIDAVDTQIAQLFSRRMQLGGAVADYKREHSLAVMNSQREQQVLERVSSLVGEDLAPDARVLFASMMDMSKALQHRRLGRPLPLLGLIENARSLPKRARGCAARGCPEPFPNGPARQCLSILKPSLYRNLRMCSRLFHGESANLESFPSKIPQRAP